MRGQKGKHNFALTLLIFGVIFAIQFVTVLLAMVAIFVLVRTGIIPVTWTGQTNIGRIILLVTVVTNVLGLIVIFICTRIPLKPLNRLTEQVDRLASGDFNARLYFGKSLTRHPTFAQLSESFNKMAEALGNTEMLRNDFINNFSHEFKTPIVSIAGFAKVLKRGKLTPEQQAEYLDIIERESLRLSYMATNVLNMTRIENQTILTDVTEFNLSEQIRSCILLLEHKWAVKGLEWRIDFPEYQICANEELLKQVWINLIDNAIKFSPNGESVEIKIQDDTETLSVSVINSGQEIAEDNKEKIFNKFYQADESHSSEGNGIGLAIVKRVVDLHQGTIAVDSKNGLTCFTVELPKGPYPQRI